MDRMLGFEPSGVGSIPAGPAKFCVYNNTHDQGKIMSHDADKFKNSKRRLKDENAVKKQTKIAKEFGVPVNEPHKFAKHHAMDCGNPDCYLCGNPRRTHKDTLTAQEKRLFQDVEKVSDKHTNGTVPP
jgi:hypothetical protein